MAPLDDNAEDESIWLNIQRGNQSAFEALYNRYFKSLYNYGRKVCSNKTIVEDAIHDLFLDLWRYRANLASTTSVRFYLYRALRRRIVKNENKDINSSLFDFQLDDLLPKNTYSHEDNMIEQERSNEQSTKLKKHLHNLSPRQYESLILRFYDELSYEEISTLLGVNEQSARNLVQRGLEQLRYYSRTISSFLFFLFSTKSSLFKLPFRRRFSMHFTCKSYENPRQILLLVLKEGKAPFQLTFLNIYLKINNQVHGSLMVSKFGVCRQAVAIGLQIAGPKIFNSTIN